MQSPVKTDIYVSWMILAAFYLYQYILRSSPGVLIEEFRHTFSMDAENFALMGSMYYYGYSIMQIPLGFLIDRKGVRSTVLWSISFCILGVVLLVITKNSFIAYFSRFIVGVGAASAFMGGIKLANDYFPTDRQGIAIGAILTFGAVGALITGAPLNFILKYFSSWQGAFCVFAVAGVFLFLLAFIYLPKSKKKESVFQINSSKLKDDFLIVINKKEILVYSFVAIGLFAPLSVMADLWGTAFLVKKFSLTRELASSILMNIYIGMAIGSVVLPSFINKYTIEKIIKVSSLFLLILFSLLVYIEDLNYTQLIVLLILIGFFCGAEMLCFTGALRYVNPNISGLTIGVVNTLNMLSGAIIQQVIGCYLDFTWHGALDQHGLRIYTTEDFIEAFSILVGIIAICTLTAFIALNNKKHKETL